MTDYPPNIVIVRRQQRTVPLATYVTMMIASNLGWVIGTLLYHWVVLR